jgi:hypothetical protein
MENKWIKIAFCISNTPFAIVQCPVCENGYLHVSIIPTLDLKHVDVHLFCQLCNARNVMTKRAEIIKVS